MISRRLELGVVHTMKITCDLHIHSALSPCALEDMSPNNIVNMALLEELTAIAVTDHNSCDNAAAVMKVAAGTGLVVIPGMEVQTREEVHVVTLFPNLDAAYAMQQYVYDTLPSMKVPAKILSKQLLMDEEDEVVGQLERLLGFSCGLSIEETVDLARKCGGLAFPAHIDRKSCSVISNLGFIPEDLSVTTLEVSMYSDMREYEEKYPQYRIVTDSDAHELGHIGMVRNTLEVETVSVNGILRVLNTPFVR